MLLLTGTSDLIQVITGQAVTVDVHASWVDNASGTITPGRTNTIITSNQTTTVVASPAASTQRNVQTLNIRNVHATSSCTVTVIHYDGASGADLIEYTLLAGETIQYVDGHGWKALTAAGRLLIDTVAASVTSTELSAVSANARSALVSVMSAVSVNSAQMTSADDAISAAVAALSTANSAAHTSIMSAVSVNSAQMTSADNAISQAVSVVAALASNHTSAIAANSAQMTSADNAISAAAQSIGSVLSDRIDSVAGKSLGGISGVSIGTLSDTQVLKWDSAAGNWHNATDATGGAGGSVEPTSNAFSVLSAAVATLSTGNSASHTSIMSAVSVNSAQMTSADNTIAAAVVALSAQHTSLAGSVAGALSAIAANSAQMTSADNAISNTLSIAAAKISSGIGLSAQARFYGGIASISAAALTNIPSMSLSLETGGAYLIEGAVIFDMLVSGTFGFGMSAPVLAQARGSYMRMRMQSVMPAPTAAGIAQGQVAFSAFGAAQTVVVSTSAAAVPAGFNAMEFKGFFNVSTGGVFQLMAKGSTAATVTLLIESAWITAYRIN